MVKRRPTRLLPVGMALVVLIATSIAGSIAAVQWTGPPPAAEPSFAAARARHRLVVAVAGRPAPRIPIGRFDPHARVPDMASADLATDLGRRLALPVEMIAVSPAVAQQALRDGTADVAIDNLPFAPDSSLGYATPSYSSGRGGVLVLRRGGVQRWGDLVGKAVCVVEGSPYASRVPAGAQPIAFAAQTEALTAFERGACAAVVDDEATLTAVLKLPTWRYYALLPGSLEPVPTFVAIAGHDPATLAWLDDTVRAWRHDGTLDRSRKKVADLVDFDMATAQSDINCH